jgi:hypothetical protein
LSTAQRSLVFFERAKIVVSRALSDPYELKCASRGRRFNRRYLAESIGSAVSVMHQNQNIRRLLQTADEFLGVQDAEGTARRR